MNVRLKSLILIAALICSALFIPSVRGAEKSAEYISVGDLAKGFSENILKPTKDLASQHLKLYFQNGWVVEYTFLTGETLTWEFLEGKGKGDKNAAIYNAVKPRENFCFVDFVDSGMNESKSVSLILDTGRNIAMAVVGFLPTKEEASIPLWQRAKEKMSLTGVKAEFIPASIDRPFTKDTPQFERTRELVGKRVQFTYSSKDAYEHLYLNEHYFTWHCISGNEKGLADTDVATYLKLDKNLYLFSWQEKIVPTLGVVIEDFDRMRSYGKIFGYEGFNFGKMINFPVGSYAKELNETEYDFSHLKKQ